MENNNKTMPDRFAEGAKKIKNLVIDEILRISSSMDDDITLVRRTENAFLFRITERRKQKRRNSVYSEFRSARKTFVRKLKAWSTFPWIAEVSRSFTPTKGGEKLDVKNGFFTVIVRDFTEGDFLAVKETPSWPTDYDLSLFERVDRLGRLALTKQERRKKILSFF